MRTFVIIALTALSFIGCSHSPTGPSTSTGSSTSAVILPVHPGVPGTPLWHAASTVVSVSATLNSCPVDHAVGDTRNVVWPSDRVPCLLRRSCCLSRRTQSLGQGVTRGRRVTPAPEQGINSRLRRPRIRGPETARRVSCGTAILPEASRLTAAPSTRLKTSDMSSAARMTWW
jgi:hypothetical protein